MNITAKPVPVRDFFFRGTLLVRDTYSSSQYCAGQRLAPHIRTLGDLEWEVESTTVTHASADWWDRSFTSPGIDTR